MSEPPRGHVALDLAPPRPPEKPPSPSTLRLAIHRVEGALPSSLVSPVVRVHLVDAASGYRWGKPAGQHCVFNEKDGKAFLRTKEEKQFPSAPWFAETGQSSFFRPFSTLPKKRGIQRELPAWDEAFLLQIQPDSRMAFLFEVLDATTNDSELRLSPVAWGFLHFAALKPSSRRVRAQLWSYRRQLCGRVALEENSDDIPLVVQEYIAAGIGEERPGALAAALASFLGRGRQRCPAALEFTFDVLQKPIQVEAPQKPESRAVEVASPKAMTIEGSPKAETVAEEEILGRLAPQHLRSKAEACILPEDLLWQIPSGKRGASRMAISPSNVLLAVAMVRSAGSELRIFSLASGRLYATCAGHNAPIEDLCWHSFQSREALVSPPLLIGCGGLAIVIYEVPENAEAPLGLSASYLKIHTKVTLSGLVRSVRPHPSMSTDPRCLILLAGGHFGLTLCQVSREVKAMPRHGANEAEQASVWVAHQPQMQQVPVEGHREVLCLRFSTQVNALENVYVTDSAGHIMLFQIRFDAAGVTASRVRTYAGSELLGVAIYELQIVTQQLLEGKRISSVQLSMADDWALVFSRDHVIRLVSLQRGVLKVEQKMLGIQCSNYSVRGTMSPDGAYVVCGSETGELLFWKDGQPLPAPIQVRLAGPLMDVVWSDRHHLVACCAMDENALPLLAFVGEGSKEKTDKLAKSKESGKESMETTLAMSTISTSLEGDHRRWADHWINANDNARSAITVEEKKRMKENILLRILDKKVEENQFAPRPP